MEKVKYRYVKYKKFTETDFELSSKIASPFFGRNDRKDEDSEHTIHSAAVSVQRAHKNLFELLRCNTWDYFITLTFGDPERDSTAYCVNEFEKWRKQMRREFKDMYYVAVPEYHEKGSIHYHVVVGGVSAAQLDLRDSGRVLHAGKAWKREDFDRRGFNVDLTKGEGATIFNVNAWTKGFSTATEIYSPSAVINYVSKYITKNNIDPRFFKKKRFYASHNCDRPIVVTDCLYPQPSLNPCPDYADLCFNYPKYHYQKYDNCECLVRKRLSGDIPQPKNMSAVRDPE